MSVAIQQVDKTTQDEDIAPIKLPEYGSIILAADASDLSNQGVRDACAIGKIWNAEITGAHVYAAKLHDKRFRQMEGGLPEQFREEDELERQRTIHDDLITKGLSIITDSYLDQIEEECKATELRYIRSSLEGKNYAELAKESNSGRYDLLVMGALGLGAVEGSVIGTVCERVMRRSAIDTLIIKTTEKPINRGPIVVAVDGSPVSFGGLLRGFSLAKAWQVPLHVISAYDPYYHYVAFNRIAGVLSDEAGKVFRFKEQEKLHEEIIDEGLAKIYDGHLHVASSMADEVGIEITTKLLDGKPYDVVNKYATDVDATLLIIGKLGIHADEDLDIGGNAENLVRNARCNVLLNQHEFTPRVDVLAEATTSWTHQAEERMKNVPVFARGMAKTAILRFAQDSGHTVITESIVKDVTLRLCPVDHGAMDASDSQQKAEDVSEKPTVEPEFNPPWTADALDIIDDIEDQSVRESIRMRSEKKARLANSAVLPEHVQAFLSGGSSTPKPTQTSSSEPGKCPFGFEASESSSGDEFEWSPEALERLERVPDGFMRRLTKMRIENWARKHDEKLITPEVMEGKYQSWAEGSEGLSASMDWDENTSQRLEKIPDFIRPMVIKEVERCATEQGATIVTTDVLKKASGTWAEKSEFHSENNADLYKDK